MTYKERIDREKDNLTSIILHSDGGLFYNLYERSAYTFHTRIKPFKVHVKTLKALSSPYVTIGVPASKINDYLNGLELSKDNPEYLVATLKEPIDENSFRSWKKHFIEQKEIEKTKDNNPVFNSQDDCQEESSIKQDEKLSLIRSCFQEIKTLNLASMTPMEAMLFLNNFQMKIKNIDL